MAMIEVNITVSTGGVVPGVKDDETNSGPTTCQAHKQLSMTISLNTDHSSAETGLDLLYSDFTYSKI